MSPRPGAAALEITNPVTGMALRILRSGAETGGTLLAMEAEYRAGSAPPPPHFHPRQEERFEILAGGMRCVVGGVARVLGAGETLVIPAGEIHSMWNPGPASARVRWEVRPALRTQEFFAAVFALAARGQVNAEGVPGVLDLALLLPHFGPEIQVTSPPAWVQRVVFGLLGPCARLLGHCPELREIR